MFLKEDGSVVWLNKAKGQWKIRPKTRNISVYREFFWNWNGVRIFSAKLLENTCDLYLEGEIKGWTPFSPLSVMGWFQAVRRYAPHNRRVFRRRIDGCMYHSTLVRAAVSNVPPFFTICMDEGGGGVGPSKPVM